MTGTCGSEASQNGEAGAGRRLSPLFAWFWVAIAAFSFQMVLVQGLSRTSAAAASLPILLPLSHVILAPFLAKNFRYLGVRLVTLGLLLNLVAMLSNGGLMPVQPSAVAAVDRIDLNSLSFDEPIPGTKNILLEKQETTLPVLSDWIIVRLPYPFAKAISPGDIFAVAGVLLTAAEVARAHRGRTAALRATRSLGIAANAARC